MMIRGRRRSSLTLKILPLPMDFSDDYSHEIEGVIYFPRCLPTKEVEESYDYIEGCSCVNECLFGKCSCLERSGTFYKYSDIGNLKNYSIRGDDIKGPTYECNENCQCKQQICGNRLVQFGPRQLLKVQPCIETAKGIGLFTLDKVYKGNFICEYAGEVITEAEAYKRFKKNNEQDKMNYIFCINEHFGEETIKTFIDPTYYGNIGRYINHSCEPNCKLFVVRINDTMPILGIFADKDIEENTEITYDYGEAELKLEKAVDYKQKVCHCNSTNCRKYLPFDLSLAEK